MFKFFSIEILSKIIILNIFYLSVKNPTQVPTQPIKTNKNVDIQEVAQKVFKNSSQISDEFMKWCHDQLKDFKGADCNFCKK